MKKHKRDKESRAFQQGFKAGIRGHSDSECPYTTVASCRGQWFGGWRKGRKHYLSGFIS